MAKRKPAKKEPPKPAKPEPTLSDVVRAKIDGALRMGATMEEAAELVGLCRKTLYNEMDRDETFGELVDAARSHANAKVEKSLYQMATGTFEVQRVLPIPGPDGNLITVTEKLNPNVTAMIFWLKNRESARWRDVQDHKVRMPKGLGGALQIVIGQTIQPIPIQG